MHKKFTFTKQLALTIVFVLTFINTISAQIYQHDFGITTITSYPYNVAPPIIHPDLSNSVWTNNTGSWVSYIGSTGQALGLANTSGAGASVTLTITVAPGKQLSVSSFSFWRQRSPSGAQTWQMLINGIAVGTGSIPATAASTGTLAVTNPVAGLTGTVNVVLALSGAPGVGTLRLDDFTLNGTVTSTCVAPTVTSITPLTGPANTLVTINGSGFQNGTGTSAVKFNGSDAAFTVVSDNLIRAYVPVAATTGLVTVTTNGCVGNGPSFTVISTDCVMPPPVTDLYISELYDQESGNGGMIEIYNPTASTINLSGYTLQRFGNIEDTSPSSGYILNLTGTLGSEMIYLVACANPNQNICAAPSSNAFLGNGFNANDKFELLKNGAVIDRVHVPFSLPGFTLIRKPDAVAPSTTYNINEWNNTQHPEDDPATNLPNNFCQDLGNHAVAPIPGTTPTLTQPVSVSICEGVTATFSVTISNPAGFTYQWKVLNAGTWVNVVNNTNYSGATSATLTITGTPATFNGNQYYCEMVSGGTCTLVSNAAQLSVSPKPAIATVTTVQPTCAITTGTISITGPLGAGLTYSLNGTAFVAGTTFTNLPAGTYNITVKNTTGCISTPLAVTINPVPGAPAVATVTTIQPTCTAATGSLTITSPLAADLTYSINGTTFQAGITFANLTPGTYNVTVKNAGGCISTPLSVTINPVPVPPVAATVTIVQPTCINPTGSITVTNPVGVGITYSPDGTNFQAGTTFNNLAPGVYNVVVKNAAGCTSAPLAITINPVPTAPAIATVTTVQPTCSVISTGSITITAPIAADITYSINGTNFQAGTTFTNLPSGTYNITVKNAAGCTSITSAIIINPAPGAPATATVTVVQPTCTVATGSITITAPIAADITYSINGTTFQAGTTFGNLAPGIYTVIAKNASGCTSSTAAITINPVPVTPAIATVTTVQPTCTAPTGSVTITNPIAADITYSIDGTIFQAGTTFANLTPGTYTITVKNAAGCTSTTPTIVISPAPGAPAVATVTIAQPTCDVATGSITVTGPIAADITYSIDGANFQAGTTFGNLTQGTYIVTVKNGAGCTSSITSITINAAPATPAIATVTTVQPTCDVATGSITVTNPVGADFTYSIDSTNFQAGTAFNNLSANTYNITVKNAAGCMSVTSAIIITPVPGAPVAPTVTTIQPTCATPTGSITVTDPIAADLTYSIDGTTFQAGTTFANLAAGTYNITVKNAAGCMSITSDIIIDPVTGAPSIATVTTVQPTCSAPTGSITITTPIGADLTYSINGTTFQAGITFANLTSGNYNVIVKNAAGCTSTTSGIIINTVPGLPQITIAQGCKNTTLGNDYIIEAMPLDNSFDISTASFEWKNGQGNTIGNDENTFDVTQYVANNSVSDFPLEFTVTVTNAEGCENTTSISVDSYFCNIPKGISPDNDGLNDTFNLTGLNVDKLSIFNRYGHEVYTKANYTNEWHGQTEKGDELPTGTYYYVIEAAGNPQTGWVYVNRRD